MSATTNDAETSLMRSRRISLVLVAYKASIEECLPIVKISSYQIARDQFCRIQLSIYRIIDPPWEGI